MKLERVDNTLPEMWSGEGYLIVVDKRQTSWGEVTHLEITREDNQPIHRWYDLFQIKTQLCGTHSLAIEIYPPSCRLIDAQHTYHLWVLPAGFVIPFGIHELDQEQLSLSRQERR
jgi:hypothetical protein